MSQRGRCHAPNEVRPIREFSRPAARGRRRRRGGRAPGPGRGRHRDLLRRPAGRRAGVAAGRRGVDPPRRPRRRVRARRQPRAAGRGRRFAGRRVELSGGIRDDASLEAALATGGDAGQPRHRRTGVAGLGAVGDRAARRPIAVGLDVRGTTLAARGWTQEGGDLWETLARLDADGCARYVVTDVHKDGTLTGPNLQLLRDVCARTDAAVVASGGVSSLDDLRAIAGLTDARRRGRDRRQGAVRRRVHPARGARRRGRLNQTPAVAWAGCSPRDRAGRAPPCRRGRARRPPQTPGPW